MPHTLSDSVRFPTRRSLRKAREREEQVAAIEPQPAPESGAPAELPVGVLLTPTPGFLPTPVSASADTTAAVDGVEAQAPRRRSVKHLIGATLSVASVAALTAATVLPVFAGEAAPEEAEARVEQQLKNSGMVDPSAALNAIGSVEIGADPGAFKQIRPEAGLVDPATLEDTDIRMPFDREWPLTDGFAYRTAPVEQFHDAQDIAAADGTPVLAIGSGKVVDAGYSSDGCGFGIKIQHTVNAETLTSRYCHMQVDSHDLKAGDTVKIGDPIGRVGNTGMSFGAHLHLSLRRSGVPIDPLPYIQERIARQAVVAEKQAATKGN